MGDRDRALRTSRRGHALPPYRQTRLSPVRQIVDGDVDGIVIKVNVDVIFPLPLLQPASSRWLDAVVGDLARTGRVLDVLVSEGAEDRHRRER